MLIKSAEIKDPLGVSIKCSTGKCCPFSGFDYIKLVKKIVNQIVSQQIEEKQLDVFSAQRNFMQRHFTTTNTKYADMQFIPH